MPSSGFTAAIEEIDKVHALDPRRTEIVGESKPAELVYAQRMSAKLAKLCPDASEALQLAVRGQHLRRWQLPRADFPMDRVGYLKWRTELKNLHARELGEIMQRCGFEPETIARAQSIVKKEHIKSDAETQALEDAACLVFLEFEFDEFAAKHEREKIIDIVRKTWAKMSSTAHSLALRIPFSTKGAEFVQAALQDSSTT